MTAGDLQAVLDIEQLSFKAPWTKGMFDETLSSPVTHSLVVEIADRIAGYIVFYFAGVELHIMNIAVDSGERGRGIAFQMMSRVLTVSRGNGIEECLLEVRESNVSARGLYEKLGFKQVGRRKNYYSESNEDALVMQLSL